MTLPLRQQQMVLDLLQDLQRAPDVNAQWQLLGRFIGALGFDKSVYAFIPTSGNKPALGEMIWLDAYPDGWLDHYMRHNYFQHDEVVKHCIRAVSPLDWSQLFDRENSKAFSPTTRQLMRDAADFGMLRGISFPVRDGSGAIGGISFGARTEIGEKEYHEIMGQYTSLLNAVGQIFHALLDRRTLAREHYDLNDREIEYLRRIADGESNETAAAKMNNSIAMINKHSRNVRLKLNSATLVQAIAKAIKLNLIDT